MIANVLAGVALLLAILSFILTGILWLIPVAVLLLAVAILVGHWAPTTLRR